LGEFQNRQRAARFEHASQLPKPVAVIGQVAEAEGDGDQIEGFVRYWKHQRIGFEQAAARVFLAGFRACGGQHGVAEIAAKDLCAPATSQLQHQVPRAAAQIQDASFGAFQDVRYSGRGVGSPVTVDVQREQVIQQVVARGDSSEHPAHPARGLFLVLRARGSRSLD